MPFWRSGATHRARKRKSGFENGSGGWTRTNNQRINSPLRYQLRYAGARARPMTLSASGPGQSINKNHSHDSPSDVKA